MGDSPEKKTIQFRVKFDSVFPIITLDDMMPSM